MRLRLLGIDTAELNSKDLAEREKALAAKTYLVQELLNKTVLIRTEKSDAFGRYLAVIILDDRNINDELLQKGLAEPFKG
jgi:endonuclease YncB( thermonuclease family)